MRTRILNVAACAIACAMLACSQQPADDGAAGNGPARPQYEFGFIIYGSQGNPFWTKVVAGVNEACDKLGCRATIQYAQNDPVKQNNLIEMMVAKQVDGLALAISNNDSYDRNVQEALDQGIPVIAFNIDDEERAAGNARLAYIGQDMEEAGYNIARRLIEDGGLEAGDHVLCPVESPEAVYAVQRFRGAKRALDEAGISSERIKTGTESLEQTLNRIKQYLLANQQTDAVLGLGEGPLQMAPQAAEEAGLDIPTAGFDLSMVIAANIQSGKTIATVDQQPFYQGFFVITQLYYNRKYGMLPCDINTGGGLVDAANIAKVIQLADTVR